MSCVPTDGLSDTLNIWLHLSLSRHHEKVPENLRFFYCGRHCLTKILLQHPNSVACSPASLIVIQRLVKSCLGLIKELLSGVQKTDINMSCVKHCPQYLICTPRQDRIYIHLENFVAYILEYNNEYQHPPRGLGSAQRNASNFRMKQYKFPAVTNSCSLFNSHSNLLCYLTAKTNATIVPN